MKEKLIITSKDQFGYLIDTFKYCEILKDKYEIIYICLNQGKKKIFLKGIEVIYISKKNNNFLDCAILNINVIKESFKRKVKKIFCIYNPLIFIVKIFCFRKRVMLDIRTGSTNNEEVKRKKSNKKILYNSYFFNEITVISESLAKDIGIKKYFRVLPLGASISKKNIEKSNDIIYLLYVGVLSNRNIIDTIKAFNILKNSTKFNVKYRIIGDFNENDPEKEIFEKYILENKDIEYLGYVEHSKLEKYFNKSHIGISYIPINSCYNLQPPTKTYEYIANGLITIATATYENKKIIKNKVNGLLCKDNPYDLAKKIEYVILNINNYDFDKIQDSIKENTWENIVNNKLINILS